MCRRVFRCAATVLEITRGPGHNTARAITPDPAMQSCQLHHPSSTAQARRARIPKFPKADPPPLRSHRQPFPTVAGFVFHAPCTLCRLGAPAHHAPLRRALFFCPFFFPSAPLAARNHCLGPRAHEASSLLPLYTITSLQTTRPHANPSGRALTPSRTATFVLTSLHAPFRRVFWLAEGASSCHFAARAAPTRLSSRVVFFHLFPSTSRVCHVPFRVSILPGASSARSDRIRHAPYMTPKVAIRVSLYCPRVDG